MMPQDDFDPEKRAKELHELIVDSVAKDKVTIAVLTTETKTVIVGTNEKRLREIQRKSLEENEIEANHTKLGDHAEEKVIAETKKLGLKPDKIGVSRKICIDCQELIEKENISTSTKFSNKKSKNRK